MSSGSISRHTAKDGRTTWRVRVDIVDPQSGQRHQPQRTFPSKKEAEKGLRAWLRALTPPDELEPPQTTRRVHEHRPTIYFLLDGTAQAIKIGRSTDVPARLRALRMASADPARLLALLPGTAAMEALLHRRFAALRLRGEWFRADQGLVDYIVAHGLAPKEYYMRHDYRTEQQARAYVQRHADVLADLATLPQLADGPAAAAAATPATPATPATLGVSPDPPPSPGAAERDQILARLAAWQDQHPGCHALRAEECAQVLHLGRHALRVLLASGALSCVPLGQRTIRIGVPMLHAYLGRTYGNPLGPAALP